MTSEDGSRFSQKGLNLLELDTGYYETWNAINDPLNGNSGIYEVDVTSGARGQKLLLLHIVI